MSAPEAVLSQVTSVVLFGSRERITATLTYRCDDPFAVSAVFTIAGTHTSWTFARDLLRDGLRARVGDGDVLIGPAGGDSVMLTLRSATEIAVLECSAQVLAKFVRRMYSAVPAGAESTASAMDRFLAQMA